MIPQQFWTNIPKISRLKVDCEFPLELAYPCLKVSLDLETFPFNYTIGCHHLCVEFWNHMSKIRRLKVRGVLNLELLVFDLQLLKFLKK